MTVAEAKPNTMYLAHVGAVRWFAYLRRGRWLSTTGGRTTEIGVPDSITLDEDTTRRVFEIIDGL